MKITKQQAPGLDHLPDEILVFILSYLHITEAVRASVLSRRWRTLWCFTSCSLYLNYYDNPFIRQRWMEGTGYERRVSRMLEMHKGTSIETLTIRASPMLSRIALIDYWITLAMEKEIKHIELDLSKIDDAYAYTLHLDKFLFILKESRPKKRHIFCLISISLSNVDVNDELIEYLISHCPQLEALSVKLSKHVEKLKVVSPLMFSFRIIRCSGLRSLKVLCQSLQSLEIVMCSGLKSLKVECPSLKHLDIFKSPILEVVEICADKLVSLIYYGQVMKLVLQNALCLSDLDIGGDFVHGFCNEPHRLCFFNPRLEKIKLNVSREVWKNLDYIYWYWPDEPHPFLYIRELELEIEANVRDSLMFFVSLVRGCPVLNKLVVTLLYDYPFLMEDDFNARIDFTPWEYERFIMKMGYGDRKHDFLKTVTIINFVGCEHDYKFVCMLLTVAKGLEELRIHPMYTDDRSKAEMRALKIRESLSPTTNLVIRKMFLDSHIRCGGDFHVCGIHCI